MGLMDRSWRWTVAPSRLHQAWEDHLLLGGMNMHWYTACALRYVQYAHSHNQTRIQSLAYTLGWILTCRWILVRLHMLQVHVHWRVRHMQLELSTRSSVSNISSGCLSPTCMSSPYVFPSTFLSPSFSSRLFHLFSLFHQLSLIHFAP